MLLNFNTVDLKVQSMQALQVNEENLSVLAESLNGSVKEGVLSFEIATYRLYATTGDWIVLFDRGRDIQTYSDKMFQRLFKSI